MASSRSLMITTKSWRVLQKFKCFTGGSGPLKTTNLTRRFPRILFDELASTLIEAFMGLTAKLLITIALLPSFTLGQASLVEVKVKIEAPESDKLLLLDKLN